MMPPTPISNARRRELDEKRHQWGRDPVRRMKQRPVAPLTDFELHRTYVRIGHLAEHMALLQSQVHEAPKLYCPYLLAGLINVLLRNFPEIELNRELTSVQAANREVRSGLKAEHDAPISFFRDLLMAEEALTTADWHYLLAHHLRVKMIVPSEDKVLNDKFKQNRPIDAYANPLVNIAMTPNSRAIEARFLEILSNYFKEPDLIGATAVPERTG
jgi:hypothetical protein